MSVGRSQIRELNDRDCGVVSEAFASQGWNKPAARFENYIAEQQTKLRSAYVAERAGRIAGYVTINWKPSYRYFADKRIPEIQDLNVLLTHRRSGVATALLDVVEKVAFERSPRVGIGVGLHSGYNAAQRLYGLRGYIPDGNGVHWKGKPVGENEGVALDDDLILYLVKTRMT